jgi:peptidyl-prolyl cis-trans isomerase SurA
LKKIIVAIVLLASLSTTAQNARVLDEIVAVVGENIVMRSDLEAEYAQAKKDMDIYDGDLKCEILNQLIIQKMYLHKAVVDSVYASAERVNDEVDRRIQYYASQIGGEKKLEQYLGKSVAEYKEQMRPKIEDQIVSQQIQQSITSAVKVSPTDVRKFFANIPEDSLPDFGTEVELALVTMKPKPSQYAKDYALEQITKIKEDIQKGIYSFEYAAKSYSDDKGSAINGGELGYFARGQMVGPFERAAYKLETGGMSDIVETDYGYHLIQLIDRKGEKVSARHILIKPLIVNSDLIALKEQMNGLITDVKNEKLTMCQVASEHSSEASTKDNCGFYADPTTGSQQVPAEALDPQTKAKLGQMKEGEFSVPEQFLDMDGSVGYKFYYLRKIVPAHKANLKDDYQKVQTLALEQKQTETIENWVKDYKKGVYVWIDDKYVGCKELEGWKGLSN